MTVPRYTICVYFLPRAFESLQCEVMLPIEIFRVVFLRAPSNDVTGLYRRFFRTNVLWVRVQKPGKFLFFLNKTFKTVPRKFFTFTLKTSSLKSVIVS